MTATLLLAWLWRERRGRAVDGPEDLKHFVNQDLRRLAGVIVMYLLAVGVYVGSRLPSRVAGRPNLRYVATWGGILGLVAVLLALAMLDWSATRRYATRHRKAITEEGLEILRDELRRRAALASPPTRTGQGGDPLDAPESVE
jgi:hypothetical protein